jgi:dihydrofolate reductase
MSINAIAAVGFNGELGLRGAMPWQGKLPRDMKHFMQVTKESVLIMGRVTADTIKLPLPNRHSIIITTKVNQTKERYAAHSDVVDSLEEAVKLYEWLKGDGKWVSNDTKAFIIGGAQIYRLAMDMGIIEKMYLTTVHGNFDSDASFSFDRTYYSLTESEVHPPDEKNAYGCTFETYQRNT